MDIKEGEYMFIIKKIIKLSKADNFIYRLLEKEIYAEVRSSESSYPHIHKWYEKVKKDIGKCREIILVVNDSLNILGISILKKTQDERKICFLKVKDGYFNMGIGSILIRESCEYLEEDNPLITVSEDKIDMFLPLFCKFNFKLMAVIDSYYVKGKCEYIYNKFDL